MSTIHYGSHGGAECGAHGDGKVPEESLTKDPDRVTCPTCRGWLPIVHSWTPKAERTVTDSDKRARATCINCGYRFKAKDVYCWYGTYDVGPLCETCDKAIKIHVRFVPEGQS